MTLALIAGRGDLPALVAAACAVRPLICGIEGVSLGGLKADLTFRLETLGTLLLELGARGVTQVCFVGGLDRPALDPSKLDAETAPLVPVFMEALQKGDDGALRVAVDLFEKTGFDVLGAHEIAPDLLAPRGFYSGCWPDLDMQNDADLAAAHICALSARDIGQACVVKAGHVIAMEDARGTDAMLKDLKNAQGGLLFKGPKAGQSRKVDLPTVGPDTLNAARGAGLRAVVVHVGNALILQFPRCRGIASRQGLSFWGWSGK